MLVENIVFTLMLIVLSIIYHEKGHYIKAENFKLKPSYKKFTVITQKNGTIKQQKEIIKGGILLGLIPVVVSFIIVPYGLALIVWLAYFFGCSSDIKKLIKGVE